MNISDPFVVAVVSIVLTYIIKEALDKLLRSATKKDLDELKASFKTGLGEIIVREIQSHDGNVKAHRNFLEEFAKRDDYRENVKVLHAKIETFQRETNTSIDNMAQEIHNLALKVAAKNGQPK